MKTLTAFCSEELLRGVDDSKLPWALGLENLGRAIEGLTPEQRLGLRKVEVVVVPPRRRPSG
jgi:hypothetical protein